MATNGSINGIYPIDYFSLPGVSLQAEEQIGFWASPPRVTVGDDPTSNGEIIELDLGRIRQVNYLNMDILMGPVTVDIEYDVLETGDTFAWKSVTPSGTFDRRISYEANRKNPWINASYNFTDERGQSINARHLRIRLTRRGESWPTSKTPSFPWSIAVKSLRAARITGGWNDTRGLIYDASDSLRLQPLDGVSADQTRRARQYFTIPPSAVRGGVVPSLMGVSFLAGVNPDAVESPMFRWTIYSHTRQVIVAQGETAPTGWELRSDKAWVNCYIQSGFEDPDVNDTYYIEAYSTTPNATTGIYTTSLSSIPSAPLDASFAFIHGASTASYSGDVDLRTILRPGNRILTDAGGDYRVQSVTYSANTLSGTVSLTSEYREASSTAVGVRVVFPVEIPKRTRTLSPFLFDDTNIVTYTGSSGLIGISVGDQVRPAGSDIDFATVIKVDGNDLTISSALPDGISTTELEIAIPDVQVTPDESMAVRVWGSVGDTGEDVLGNPYRHSVVRSKAQFAIDRTELGWISEPQPDPRAVECLYLDVRNDDGSASPVDAVRAIPVAPGLRMNVYATQEGGSGTPPADREVWDHMRWSPLGSFLLAGMSTFTLPRQTKARFIKLEFTNLTPLPFSIPSAPELPARTFYRHPTWVERLFYDPTFDGYQRVVEDWFTRVTTTGGAMKLQKALAGAVDDPVEQFSIKQRYFLAYGPKSGLNAAEASYFDGSDFIDPVTKSKIRLLTNRSWRDPVGVSVDTGTLLGQVVSASFAASTRGNPVEAQTINSNTFQSDFVSTPGGSRIELSYSMLAQSQSFFDLPSLHLYRKDVAKFNGKAYFAGVREVEVLQIDYTVPFDDLVVDESFSDDRGLEHSDFEVDESTDIPQPTVEDGQSVPNVYVSYEVNGQSVQMEPLVLRDYSPVTLSLKGGPAEGLQVVTSPTSTYQLRRGEDYSVSFPLDDAGIITTTISRARGGGRLVLKRDLIDVIYEDGDVVQIAPSITGTEG